MLEYAFENVVNMIALIYNTQDSGNCLQNAFFTISKRSESKSII